MGVKSSLPGGKGPQRPLKFVIEQPRFADALEALDGGDGDSFWANSQHGFVNIPVAIAAAALSLSVATSNSLNQQDDTLQRVIGESASQSVISIGDEPRGFAFQAEDELPTRIDETYEWRAQWIQVAPVVPSPWTDDSFVPAPAATIVDETYWYQPASDPTVIQLVNWPEAGIGDGTPAAPSFTEEQDWSVQTPSLVAAQPIYLPDASGDIQHSLQIEESDWNVWTPSLVPPVLQPVWHTDEMVTAAAAFVPEENYWYQPQSYPVDITIVPWPQSGIGDGGQAVPIEVQEENWQVWTPPLVPAQRLYLPDPEQIPGNLIAQAFGAQSFTAVNWRALTKAKFFQWASSDDLPIAPIPLPFDEEPWQVKFPPLVAAQPLFLPDPEQVPSGLVAPPIIEEEDFRVKFPPLVAAAPIWLPDPEQIPAGLAAPPIIEEEDWRVWTPPLVAAHGLHQPDVAADQSIPPPLPLPFDEENWQVFTPDLIAAQPLYLPDPEEIPAGSLIPTPVVDTDTDGAGRRTIRRGWHLTKEQVEQRREAEREKPKEPPKAQQLAEESRATAAEAKAVATKLTATRQEIASLLDQINEEGIKRTLKEAAQLEKQMLFAKQQETLLAVQEAVLLEEMEVLDVAYVALMAMQYMNS